MAKKKNGKVVSTTASGLPDTSIAQIGAPIFLPGSYIPFYITFIKNTPWDNSISIASVVDSDGTYYFNTYGSPIYNNPIANTFTFGLVEKQRVGGTSKKTRLLFGTLEITITLTDGTDTQPVPTRVIVVET